MTEGRKLGERRKRDGGWRTKDGEELRIYRTET